MPQKPPAAETMNNEHCSKQSQSNPIHPPFFIAYSAQSLGSPSFRNAGEPGRSAAEFRVLLLWRRLAEHLLFNKLSQSFDQLFGVCSLGPDLQPGPHGSRQHAHLHNTLAVHIRLAVADGQLAIKPVCNIDKL